MASRFQGPERYWAGPGRAAGHKDSDRHGFRFFVFLLATACLAPLLLSPFSSRLLATLYLTSHPPPPHSPTSRRVPACRANERRSSPGANPDRAADRLADSYPPTASRSLPLPLPPMGGWNRRRQPRSHHDGSRRPSHPRPPLPPCPGYNHCPVPLWEREFCCYVGGISWQRFCENKNFVDMYKEIEQWDDSAAFENFQNAKSRFCANYHGQPSDIPLPDPDMYIDKVDHRCKIDPELVAELDKVRLPFEADNDLAPAAGLGNTDASNKCTQNQSGNWDVYLEKQAEINKWEEDNSRSNLSWGLKHDPLNKWSKNSSGWGDALAKPGWGSSSNNHYSSNNWNSPHGASNNTYQDPTSTYGRKRNSGGYSQQRNSKQRNQTEINQRGRWHRGRNSEMFPFDNRPNGQRVDRGF